MGNAVGFFWCNTGPLLSNIRIKRGHFIEQITESVHIWKGEVSTYLHISAYISIRCAAVYIAHSNDTVSAAFVLDTFTEHIFPVIWIGDDALVLYWIRDLSIALIH